MSLNFLRNSSVSKNRVVPTDCLQLGVQNLKHSKSCRLLLASSFCLQPSKHKFPPLFLKNKTGHKPVLLLIFLCLPWLFGRVLRIFPITAWQNIYF